MGKVVEAPEGYTFSGDCKLEVHTCSTCGMLYAIPERMAGEARELGHGTLTWRCPRTGCASDIGFHDKSEAEREQHRLGNQLRWAREDAARETARADQAEASTRGQKAAKTRARNERDTAKRKAAAALCPVPGCKRRVKQMARHLETKHPDYSPATHDHD